MMEFGDSVKFAEDVLSSVSLADVEDLDEARETIVKLSEQKAAVSEYKRNNPSFEHYQVRITL